MRFSTTTLLPTVLIAISSFSPLAQAQVAAGGGALPATQAETQFPISTTAAFWSTAGGTTTVVYQLFVQTFATTALGSWDLGPTPAVGTIGLGDIQGEVGKVKTKRALETPAPRIRGSSE
jgi:hypothetical protein